VGSYAVFTVFAVSTVLAGCLNACIGRSDPPVAVCSNVRSQTVVSGSGSAAACGKLTDNCPRGTVVIGCVKNIAFELECGGLTVNAVDTVKSVVSVLAVFAGSTVSSDNRSEIFPDRVSVVCVFCVVRYPKITVFYSEYGCNDGC